MQVVREGEEVSYTYDVFWPELDVPWGSRWDGYRSLKDARTHWDALWTTLVCLGLPVAYGVALVLYQTLHRDHAAGVPNDSNVRAHFAAPVAIVLCR